MTSTSSERLYAVAYGCAMLLQNPEHVHLIAQRVFELQFQESQPAVHVLLRDYGRGVIERVLALDPNSAAYDPAKFRPPYVSDWPTSEEPLEILEAEYHREGDFTWSSIWSSVMSSMGDFHRYIMEPRLDSFVLGEKNGIPESYPLDRAARWMFSEVVKLGWTPERFGDFDNSVNYYRARSEHLTERIGKKYQWIALHKLLGILSDHLPVVLWWNRASEPYDGPWQIGGRDIDPSLLLSNTKRPEALIHEESWWAPMQAQLPAANAESRQEWVLDHRVPDPTELMIVVDTNRKSWLTAEGYYHWEEAVPPEGDRWQSERAALWYQVRSYLIRDQDLDKFSAWAQSTSWLGRWMPEGGEYRGVFLGEVPWHPAAESEASGWLEPGTEGRGNQLGVAMLPTSWSYHWEASGFDRSVEQGVWGLVPCPQLIQALDLHWSGNGFRFVGPAGSLVAFDPTADSSGPHALLLDQETFSTWLAQRDYSLVWTLLGEKLIHGPDVQRSPRLYVSATYLLDGDKPKEITFLSTGTYPR